MNLRRSTAVELAKAVARGAGSGVDVGVAPPFVYLDAVAAALAGSSVLLGAQDAYFQKDGAFTGEISLDMLKDLGVKFVLAGHSERRHVLLEPPSLIAAKAKAIYGAGLTLIHCVGETLDQREANKTFDVVAAHVAELEPSLPDPQRLVVAYEPVWAIGTGRNATDAQAQEVHAFIRDLLAKRYSPDFAAAVRIQYGGSLKPDNAAAIFSQPDVDGGLVGGASLKSDSFLALVAAAR